MHTLGPGMLPWLAEQAHLRIRSPYPGEGQGPPRSPHWPTVQKDMTLLCSGKQLLCGQFVGGLAAQQCNTPALTPLPNAEAKVSNLVFRRQRQGHQERRTCLAEEWAVVSKTP